MISNPQEYVQALQSGRVDKVQGVHGRILRGDTDKDFETLTDDPENRRVVFPTDESGLESLLGKSGYEMLIAIGYPADYIEQLVGKGKKFKLVVFPEGKDSVPATWMNVFRVVSEAYPLCKRSMYAHGAVIQTYNNVNFSALEKKIGKTAEYLNEIKSRGSSDPEFMSAYRYMCSPDTAENARLFLYFTVGLNNLFAGDGFTRDKDNKKGLKEYLLANKKISDMDGAVLIDIDVKLP